MPEIVHTMHEPSSVDCAYGALLRAPEARNNLAMINNVYKLRSAKGYSQEELADRAGIARTQITRMEAGTLNPTLSTLQKMASALDCEVRDLFLSSADEASAEEIVALYSQLNDAQRAEAVRMLEYLRSRGSQADA